MVELTDEIKFTLEKTKCEYRQASRKIKQAKIYLESETKKIESCAQIDFKFLAKNLANMPEISYEFVSSQLELE